MSYTIDTQLSGEFDEIVERVEDALAAEGFGILCDIDVQGTFAQKLDLDEDYRQYRILGACNPALAHEALGSERKLGALLPCNVIVYEHDDGTIGVSAVEPERLLSVVDDSDLDSIASDVHERFERVLASLSDTAAN
jgi:uncharacterized protein (DUF302 family)